VVPSFIALNLINKISYLYFIEKISYLYFIDKISYPFRMEGEERVMYDE